MLTRPVDSDRAFGVGVRWAGGYVVEFEVGERRDPNDAMRVGL